MMIVFHSTGGDAGRNFLHEAWQDVDLRYIDELQSLTSLLYRDPDAIGLLHCHDASSAPHTVRGIRLGNIRSRLFITLPEAPTHAQSAGERSEVLFAGADDVQSAEIDERELAARLKVLAARGEYVDHTRIDVPGAVFLSSTSGFNTNDGRYVRVPPKSGAILVELARRPGQTRSKRQIMDALYAGSDDEPYEKIIDVLVCKLRQRLVEATGGLDCVQTIWGRGYQFVPEGFRPAMLPTRVRVLR